MAEMVWSLRPPGAQALEPDRDGSPLVSRGETRTRKAEGLRCSFCQTELGENLALTISASGADGRRALSGSYCSPRCRDCVRALAALHPSPLASSDFISARALLTDRLLDLWRRGQGPDPALVLRAAEAASSGLTLDAAI